MTIEVKRIIVFWIRSTAPIGRNRTAFVKKNIGKAFAIAKKNSLGNDVILVELNHSFLPHTQTKKKIVWKEFNMKVMCTAEKYADSSFANIPKVPKMTAVNKRASSPDCFMYVFMV